MRSTCETRWTVGAGLCREEAVRAILTAGPRRVKELEELGVTFERRSGRGEEYDLGREGGHSRRRVLHAGDFTGREVVKALLARVHENPAIELKQNLMAIDLITTGWLKRPGSSRCVGAYFLDRVSGEILAVRAPHTILATGGAGKIYLYTSNPDVATGDGVAMAWRVGLPIRNMEMVQFHPTCLYHPAAKSFLISEAVRGEGGVLVNAAGESFMDRYDPRGSLAPRDVVARAIDNEMKTRGDTCVYLDITKKSVTFPSQALPEYLRDLPQVRDRHGARSDPRRARRSLFLRRCGGGRGWPHLSSGTVRGGRGVVHGFARRQPTGEQFASRGACVRVQHGGERFDGAAGALLAG